VYHHGVTTPDIIDLEDTHSIFPPTTISFPEKRLNMGGEKVQIGYRLGLGNAYLPIHNTTVPARVVFGRSVYLGANLTLTNEGWKDGLYRPLYTSLIDGYNKNGKKEGWYVEGGGSYTYLPR
jgi:hypothetical protein